MTTLRVFSFFQHYSWLSFAPQLLIPAGCPSPSQMSLSKVSGSPIRSQSADRRSCPIFSVAGVTILSAGSVKPWRLPSSCTCCCSTDRRTQRLEAWSFNVTIFLNASAKKGVDLLFLQGSKGLLMVHALSQKRGTLPIQLCARCTWSLPLSITFSFPTLGKRSIWLGRGWNCCGQAGSQLLNSHRRCDVMRC